MREHGILPLLCILVLAGLSSGYSWEDLEIGCEDGEGFLQHGYEYWYRYRSEAGGAAVGTTDDATKMILECIAHVSHLRTCVYSLKLSECKLTALGGPPNNEKAWLSNYDLSILSEYPVTFSFSNGEIKSIFVETNDPLYSVNIKRGVLSAFAIKTTAADGNIEEMHTDIHGTCPWKSTPVSGEAGHVQTTKDMLHCAFPSRPDWFFSPWSMFWNMSFIQYVINSSADCDYNLELDEKRIELVVCKERHAIMLESTHHTTTAVQTNIHYSMEFMEYSVRITLHRRNTTLGAGRITSIQFEYDHTPDPVTQPPNFLEKAEKMMADLVETSVDEVRVFTITMFNDFVAWIRASPDLIPFVESVTSCRFIADCPDRVKVLALDYLRDALIQCNSVPCVRAFTHLVTTGHVTENYLRLVLFSWSNIYNIRPAYIEEALKICKTKESRLCWLILGELVNKFDKENPHLRHSEVPSEIEKVTDYVYNKLGSRCDLNEGENTENVEEHMKVYDKLTFLKTVENIGRAYKITTNGFKQLHNCALNKDAPFSINLAAVKALQKIDICEEKRTCKYMYERLFPVLKDPSWDIELRILIYQLLVLNADKVDLAEDLAKLLKEESISQLKTYIASHLKSYIKESKKTGTHKKFLLKFEKECETHEVDIDSLLYDAKGKSTIFAHERFVNLPFMPEEINGFGTKLEVNMIYGLLSSLPQGLSANLTMELFSKVFNLLEVEISARGWKKSALWFMKHFPDKAEDVHKWVLGNAFEILQKLGVIGSVDFPRDDRFLGLLNPAFEDNIKRLRNMFFETHKDVDPSLITFIKFLGKNLGFFPLQDLFKFYPVGYAVDPEKVIGNVKNGVTYNSTHVIRVIEAYHQVPTMMGLPLNWTTNATLAYSIKAGLQGEYGGKRGEEYVRGRVFFHPSAALTFLNRMVLDLPTVTQIGVQANTSAYTSTRWTIDLNISEQDKIRMLSLQHSEKPQKILELFRTNHLIKHQTYEEIKDWDIDRVHVSKCSDDSFNEAVGIQICHEKSYANVTHRIKPWFLMAGWAKWSLEAKTFDKELKSYNLALVSTKSRPFLVELKYDAPGSLGKREVNIVIKEENYEVSIQVTAPDRPNFGISFTVNNYKEEDIPDGRGHRGVILVNRSNGHKYKATFTHFDGTQSTTPSHFKLEEDQVNIEKVKKRVATFQTPFNTYQWIYSFRKSMRTMKVDSLLSYENFDKDWNWVDNILPCDFWEDSKAWIQVQADWDIAVHKEKGDDHRHTTTYIYIPYSNIKVITHSMKLPGRSYVRVNASKSEAATGKLLTFANFGFDSWTSESGKVLKHIRNYNVTIPRLSWALNYVNVKEDNTNSYNVTLSRAKMHPKEEEGRSYVGWWDSSIENQFNLQESNSRLLVRLTRNDVGYGHLPENVVEVLAREKEAVFADSFNGYVNVADISLLFPVHGKEESVTFNGKFIKMHSTNPYYWSFQMDNVLKSSYLNTQLDSHSVIAMPDTDTVQSLVFHKSFVTHFTTGNRATYNLNFQSGSKGGCYLIDLNHNISSRMFDFSSFVKLYCHHEIREVLLQIGINTHSSYWDVLNSNLKQIFKNKYDAFVGGESMNFTHSLFDINVVANWDEKGSVVFQKKAVLTSKNNKIPNMELNIKDLSDGHKQSIFEIAHEEPYIFTMDRQLNKDFMKSHYVISHKLGNNDEVQDLEMDVKLANPYQIYTAGKAKVDTIYELKEWLKTKLEILEERFVAASKDPNHPLNKMVEPNLKMTLAEYWKSVQEEIKRDEAAVVESILEALESLAPFYQPSLDTVTNSVKEVTKLIKRTDDQFRQKTATGWAFYYFNVPGALHDLWIKSPDILFDMLKVYTRGNLRGTTMEFSSQQALPFYLKSFREFPVLKLSSLYSDWFEHQKRLSSEFSIGKGKVALIFGPRHVYTFDGLFYEFPVYPAPGCTVLLAHEPYDSSFSVLSTEDSLHLIFPEMALTINSKNELFVNGSKEQHPLPLQSTTGNVFIKREGRILSVSTPGLDVACDSENMLCTFVLHYLHHGGIFGLLGNADGERYNEWKLPNGMYVYSAAEASKVYEVSGEKECKNFQSPQYPSWDDYDRYSCHSITQSRCLQIYKATSGFKNACLFDLSQEGKVCYSTAGMAAFCHHVHLSGENECETLTERETPKKQLDVVLIVNENSLMFNSGSSKAIKGLESMLDAIENKFESEGYTSISYSLVGFGGKGLRCDPHLVTLKSDLWVSHKDILDTLKTLSFDGTLTCDVVQALKYAIDYLGFDTLNSKVILLFTEKDRMIQLTDTNNLNTIQKSLEGNGLTLYTFANYPSLQKGKKVFGVRADGYIFPTTDKGAYLDYPKGMLAKLTSATRGSLFLKQFVEDNSPSTYFSIVAEEIWAKVHHEANMCRACKLEEGMWWTKRTMCSLQVCKT